MYELAMEDTRGLLLGIVAWSAGFCTVRSLLRKRSWDFCNRCISMVHVFVAVFLCMASVQDWSRPLDGIGGVSTPLQASAAFLFQSFASFRVSYENIERTSYIKFILENFCTLFNKLCCFHFIYFLPLVEIISRKSIDIRQVVVGTECRCAQ